MGAITANPNASQNAQNPSGRAQAAAALPFPIASRMMKRLSFNVGPVAMAAAAVTNVTPIQIPAVGYIRRIVLEVTFSGTGGTAFTADGPFNIISSSELRTAAGNDIVVPYTGYQLFLLNKYGHPGIVSPYSDPRVGSQYSTTAGTAAHFFLDIPLEIDKETGLGAIPALASNRSYQINLAIAPYSVVTGATAGNVTINATVDYWSEPPQVSASGIAQQTEPDGLGMISQWQLDSQSLTPGDKLIKFNNVGNILRTAILVLRNSSGARIETNGWPASSELYLDNEPMLYYTLNEWKRDMITAYGLDGATMDAAKGLDTGVFAIPFSAFAGSLDGDPANSRSQYLPTLDASQLQLRGTSWGSAVSTIEILTNAIVPKSSADVFNK